MPESGRDSDTGKCISNIRGGSQPRLATPGSPFQRKGRECGAFQVYRSLLPLEGGARRAEVGGAERSKKERLKSTIYENTLSTADAVPLPRWGRLRGAALRVDVYKGRCPKVVSSHQPLKTTHPCFQTTGFNGFRRFKGFRWRLRRILDDGIPVSSAFPSRGRCPEGADRAQAV